MPTQYLNNKGKLTVYKSYYIKAQKKTRLNNIIKYLKANIKQDRYESILNLIIKTEEEHAKNIIKVDEKTKINDLIKPKEEPKEEVKKNSMKKNEEVILEAINNIKIKKARLGSVKSK